MEPFFYTTKPQDFDKSILIEVAGDRCEICNSSNIEVLDVLAIPFQFLDNGEVRYCCFITDYRCTTNLDLAHEIVKTALVENGYIESLSSNEINITLPFSKSI